MQCRGIRGAITVPLNNRESILDATKELLREMVQANKIEIGDISAIFFTTTQDLNAEFPAVATREMGWPHYMPLLCAHEMKVPHDLAHCLRILMLVNTEKEPAEITHVYLGEAKNLKEQPSGPVGGNG